MKIGPYVSLGKNAAAELALDDLLREKHVDAWDKFNMLVLKRKIKAKYFDLYPVKKGTIHRAMLYHGKGDKILMLMVHEGNWCG